MSSPISITSIKQQLTPLIGQSISLKTNCGRNRFIENNGILESLYPNVFTVRLTGCRADQRVSYSYNDLLTHSVRISVNTPA